MAVPDNFLNKLSKDTPATGGQAVVNDVDLAQVSRAIWVGVAGNMSAKMKDGQTLVYANMTVGWHPLRITQVTSVNTTATNITAVW